MRSDAAEEVGFARERERLAKAPLHQRNNTLNLCAFPGWGNLPRSGSGDRVKATSELANIAKTIGLDEPEIEPTINSGFRAGVDSPAPNPFVKVRSTRTPSAPASGSNLAKNLAMRLGETDTDNAERFVCNALALNVIFSVGQGGCGVQRYAF